MFRKDCQRAHREIFQKLLDWSVDIYEWELKNEIENCTEFLTVGFSLLLIFTFIRLIVLIHSACVNK